jgi:hypothetical protein
MPKKIFTPLAVTAGIFLLLTTAIVVCFFFFNAPAFATAGAWYAGFGYLLILAEIPAFISFCVCLGIHLRNARRSRI